MKNILLNMYNEVWFTGEIPDTWRKYQVNSFHRQARKRKSPAHSIIIMHRKTYGKISQRTTGMVGGTRR